MFDRIYWCRKLYPVSVWTSVNFLFQFLKSVFILQDCSLQQIMDHETDIVKDTLTLHSDMQTLVYENYNKFISATDTVKKVGMLPKSLVIYDVCFPSKRLWIKYHLNCSLAGKRCIISTNPNFTRDSELLTKTYLICLYRQLPLLDI